MVAEVFAGLGAIKTAFDIAKGLKDIDDAARRNAAVIELQEKILAAHETQAALLDRVGELEKKVAGFETWERESQRYELKNVGFGGYAYVLKNTERGTAPPHWVCTNCYEHRHIATLQYGFKGKSGPPIWHCPSCGNTIDTGTSNAKWID
jgi:rubrerythrin